MVYLLNRYAMAEGFAPPVCDRFLWVKYGRKNMVDS